MFYSRSNDNNNVPNKYLKKEDIVLGLYKSRHNVIITGKYQSGKSYLVRKIKELSQIKNETLLITSSTNFSSLIVDGMSIYSRIKQYDYIDLSTNLQDNIRPFINPNFFYSKLRTIIIDNASFISGDDFDNLSQLINYRLKRYSKPFGNYQVILLGDFYQYKTPPIDQNNEEKGGDNIINTINCDTTEDAIDRDITTSKVLGQIIANNEPYREVYWVDLDRFNKLYYKNSYSEHILDKIRIGKLDLKVKKFLKKKMIPNSERLNERLNELLDERPNKRKIFNTENPDFNCSLNNKYIIITDNAYVRDMYNNAYLKSLKSKKKVIISYTHRTKNPSDKYELDLNPFNLKVNAKLFLDTDQIPDIRKDTSEPHAAKVIRFEKYFSKYFSSKSHRPFKIPLLRLHDNTLHKLYPDIYSCSEHHYILNTGIEFDPSGPNRNLSYDISFDAYVARAFTAYKYLNAYRHKYLAIHFTKLDATPGLFYSAISRAQDLDALKILSPSAFPIKARILPQTDSYIREHLMSISNKCPPYYIFKRKKSISLRKRSIEQKK